MSTRKDLNEKLQPVVDELQEGSNERIVLSALGLLFPWFALMLLFREPSRQVQRWIEVQLIDHGSVVYGLPLLVGIGAILVLALGPWGRLVLGPDDATPEFDDVTYFSMLFAGGGALTSALLLAAGREVLSVLQSPPPGVTATAGRNVVAASLGYLWFRWGIVAWCVYVMFALPMGYYCYRHGAPFRPSSVIYPFVEDRPSVTAAIDTLVVVVVGTAIAAPVVAVTSTFIAGIEFHWNVNVSSVGTIIFTLAIACVYISSAVTGLHRGIRRLSVLTVAWMALVAGTVAIFGPSRAILSQLLAAGAAAPSAGVNLVANLGESNVVRFWGIWFGGAPAVGLFMARISHGRTVREVVAYAAAATGLATTLWYSVIAIAVTETQFTGRADIIGVVSQAGSGFAAQPMFGTFPAGEVILMLFLGISMLSMITSADSVTLSLAMAASSTPISPSRVVRVYWGVVTVALAAVGASLQQGSLNVIGGAIFGLVGMVGVVSMAAAAVRDDG
jgi:choline-glycine betaine transporter